MSNLNRGYLLGFIGILIFGLTLPLTKIAVAELHPLFVSIGRTVLAAAVALPLLLLNGEKRPDRSQLRKLVVIAAGVVIGFPALSAIAMQWAPAAHGGVVLGALPLVTAIMSTIFAGERPSPAFWMWSTLGSTAVIVFALWDGGAALHLADTLLVMAVIAAAIGYAAGGDLSRTLGGWQTISWALVIALPLTLPATLLLLPGVNWQASAPAWSSFVYLALMSQLLGFFAWNKGLATGGVAKVGQIQLLQTFVTIAASAVMLHETISLRTITFALIVAACVWFGRKATVRRAAA